MNPYQAGMRRMLVDMHIPDWDPGFLARYDVKAMADLYARARLSSVMFYCKSHAGLCHYPTKVGKVHGNLAGRDTVAEMLAELSQRGIATCAYTSVVFDNWAVEEHPSWRQVRADGFDGRGVFRYGFACINNPEYQAYEFALLTELLSTYRFDGLFIDMPFWPIECACEHCVAHFRALGGEQPPTVIDWASPAWAKWQAMRERSSDAFIEKLTTLARRVSPGIAVTHNMAPALTDYYFAQPLRASRHDDFVAGDLYGDRYEQLFVTKLSLHLTETRPAEFMTSRCTNLEDHVRLKREDEMMMQAAAATALSSAFLFIDAIDPTGAADPAVFERIGRIFERTAPYEPFLGGEPVEDVAVYYSADSRMNFADNGTQLQSVLSFFQWKFPHKTAVQGACRALQRAHIPFGVITRKQLGALQRWPVLVLPSVLRMDDEEVAAIRAYVKAGGRVYASGWTSLLDTSGTRRSDFALSDVFGAAFAAEEEGRMVYLRPAVPEVAEAILPQRLLSVNVDRRKQSGMPRVRLHGGSALAHLTLPYAYPARGNARDHKWSSIHSSPPWEATFHPVLVRHDFGAGSAVYCAADIESLDAEANEGLFVQLIRTLLRSAPSFSADTHPAVWVNAFDQADRARTIVSFLNYQADLPAPPVPAAFTLRPPPGKHFTGLSLAPIGTPLDYRLDAEGVLHAKLDRIEVLALVVATYVGQP